MVLLKYLLFISFISFFNSFTAWPLILTAASDAVGVDKQPKMENQFYSFFFFVAFILFVSLFIVNLVLFLLFLFLKHFVLLTCLFLQLVGEIVYHFYESRGDALLTGEQKKWRGTFSLSFYIILFLFFYIYLLSVQTESRE